MAVITNEQVGFFRDNGYLIVRQLIDETSVQALSEALMNIINGHDKGIRRRLPVNFPDGTKITKFDRIWDTNPVFSEFMNSSSVGEAAAQLMDTPEVRLFYDQFIFKEAKVGGPVPCHQDLDYWRHVSTSNLVTAWMALTKVIPENGCMYVIPGSHKWGLIDCVGYNILKDPNPEYFLTNCISEEKQKTITRVPLILEPGDVSFHHSLTVHCSYHNTSELTRLGYIHHYLPADARYRAELDIHKHHEIDVPDGELLHSERFPLVWMAQQTT
ncbi:MAG TPA: phytanoyl-CoA dioxygenase family protein [Anaerolineales bacterium]|nr:phytanoyl-CoA dioxygenase family protein [Anaerolineales bacterium]